MTLSRRRFAGAALAAGAGLAAGVAAPAIGGARPSVVVLGAGPAGMSAARALAASDGVAVTLVEPLARYTSCFSANLYLAGLQPFESIDHAVSVGAAAPALVRERAVSVDTGARRVRLSGGATLEYDRLVVAPGIALRFDTIEGYGPHALERMPHAYFGGGQQRLLRAQLEAMPDGGLFVISAPALPFRCPPAPYERASLVAWYLSRSKPRSKILILDAKDQHAKQGLFHEAWARLYGEMVEWVPASMTDGGVRALDAGAMTLDAGGEIFRADVANVIPPQRAADIARDAGLTDAGGWCPVRPDNLASMQVRHVHVLGDAIDPGEVPKSAFAARSQGAVCAAAILAELSDRAPPPAAFSSVCWSYLSADSAVKVAADYEVRDGEVHQSTGFISSINESAQVRTRNVEEARAWYQETVSWMYR